MDMSRWSIKTRISFGILFLGLLMLGGVCVWHNNGNAESNIEKKVIKGEAMWPAYSFASAVDEAVTIVHGRVVDKSSTKVHQMANVNGQSYNEYYREVSIEVIDILKGKMEDAMVTYLEFGGETEELIYVFDDIEPVEINGEYIFFLNYHGAALSPMTLLPVDNGTVLTQGKIIPTSTTSTLSSDISVESYLREIESALAD